LNLDVTVIVADLDLLVVDDHPLLDVVLVTIPRGKKSVATATETTIATAEEIATALGVPSIGRLPEPFPNLPILTFLRLLQ
jgi:hypothetical protein